MLDSVCFCSIAILLLIIHVVLAVWVYRDAEKRGKNGALWVIVFFVGGILGLIVWLIVRPSMTSYSDFDDERSFDDDREYKY